MIPPQSISPGRLQFIDALRAYAILMMLQGHFVHIMLDQRFQDLSSPVYSTWAFLRGMTAPIFFTITGLVFVYLLLRKGLPLRQNPRVRKGLRRGLQLIGIGYLLQINFFQFFSFEWQPHWWKVDVLHCIGLALLCLIALYALHQKTGISLPWLLGSIGVVIFVLEPIFAHANWAFLPRFWEHYFTREHGSAFTPLPWVGYALIGGVIGWHISRDTALYRTPWWPCFFLLSGWILHAYSSPLMVELHEWSGLLLFKQIAYNNYLFIRLGHVFMVLALFIWIEVLAGKFPRLLLKVGAKTLLVYEVHYVLLYGSWFGVGIVSLGKYSLSPWACALGAVAFVSGFLLLIHFLPSLRAWGQRQVWDRGSRSLRHLRVWLLREGPHWLQQSYRQSAAAWQLLRTWLKRGAFFRSRR